MLSSILFCSQMFVLLFTDFITNSLNCTLRRTDSLEASS